VLVGGRACEAAASHRGRALRNVLAIKVSLASVVTLIAVLTGARFPTGARDAMLVLLAMSMGAQLAAIRFLKVPDLLTVVLTMTITVSSPSANAAGATLRCCGEGCLWSRSRSAPCPERS
jgi:hypothetical protein